VFPLGPYRVLNRDGGVFLQVLSDNCYFFYHRRGPLIKIPVPVGRYKTVLVNGGRIVLLGNLKLAIFAGSSMVPFAKVRIRKTG
jgi:hypothetical protein